MDVSIAHISDIHVGKMYFMPEKLEQCIDEVNESEPNAVVITGDITMFGFREEYERVRKYIRRFDKKPLVMPGNHDVRYRGDVYFEKYFGKGNKVKRISQDLRIIGLDSSVPDLDEGTVGRGRQIWLKRQLEKVPEGECKIVALHHHLIPIPGTGRERNILTDAGDVLEILVKNGVDIALCGHRHTPYTWMVNNLVVATAGTPSSVKVRAEIPQCYNIVNITDEYLEVKLKEVGGEEKIMSKFKCVK